MMQHYSRMLKQSALPTTESLHILCVDDDENVLKALGRIFHNESFRMLSAPSGQEGLALLRDNLCTIGLILSDQKMPGMSGSDFLEAARELVPDVPRLILTGYSDVHAAIDAINQGGAVRFLTKPWHDQELLQAVRDSLHRFLLLRENQRLNDLVARQNRELREWNNKLSQRVMEQTGQLRQQVEETQRMNQRLQQTCDGVLLSFSDLLELRNSRVRNHSRSVAFLAERVARDLRLDNAACETIWAAGLLHDIGKIGISDKLLSRNIEGMSPDERREYQLHAVRGQTAVDKIDAFREIGVLIRHHHEAFDGSGFPDGLAGNRIPLGARIIAVADFAVNVCGASSKGAQRDRVIQELRELMGPRFDPELTQAVTTAVKEIIADMPVPDDMVEEELVLGDLLPGMIVCQDILSGTRVLLLQKGTVLGEAEINALKRHASNDPLPTGVRVLMKTV